MKSIFIMLGSGLLATTLAVAQETPSSNREGAEPGSNSPTSTQTSQTSNSVIRGCLSGSDGNYTISDQNGTQYSIAGTDNELQARVGHEVEVTVRQDMSSQSASQGEHTMSRSSNTVQVSDLRDVGATCNKSGLGTSPPDNGASPKAAPDTSEAPRMMAMLQQQSRPDERPAAQQGNPPVTSQTPAAAAPSTDPQQGNPSSSGTTPSTVTSAPTPQSGTSPANNTGMTESEANHDAQAARQGELSTNPQTGNTTGRGVDDQGVNNPTTTQPNAVPSSPNSATPSSATQPPQANDNDRNKRLYERQATDIPWANSNGNSGTNPPPQNNPPH
jgi:hypothetical protein